MQQKPLDRVRLNKVGVMRLTNGQRALLIEVEIDGETRMVGLRIPHGQEVNLATDLVRKDNPHTGKHNDETNVN